MAVPEWPLSESYSCPELEGADPALQEEARAWAGELLWRLTGRQFGLRAQKARPFTPTGGTSYEVYGVWLDTGFEGGQTWFPTPGVRAAWCAGGGPGRQVWLPGPVQAVTEVRVRGEVLDPAAYRVDGGRWLIRQDGGVWVYNTDIGVPEPEAELVVTYERGVPVPEAGRIAASALACEYVKFRAGLDHRLTPGTVTSITRQGVEMEVLPVEADGWLTGVHEADQWIRAVNPYRLAQRPKVASLDWPEPGVQTWP